MTMNEFFGTSDSDANSTPRATISHDLTGAALEFPSVPGNSYRVESSDDLVHWTPVMVTATGSTTIYQDPAAANIPRRFYRVAMP